MHRKQYRELRKIKKRRNVFQTKEEDNFLETNVNEIDISDLPDREFKIMVIRMLQNQESNAGTKYEFK